MNTPTRYLHIVEVDVLVINEDTTPSDLASFDRDFRATAWMTSGALVRTGNGSTRWIGEETFRREYAPMGEAVPFSTVPEKIGQTIASVEGQVDVDQPTVVIFYSPKVRD